MRLPFVPTVGCCRVCGRAVEGMTESFLCSDCSGSDAPAFDAAASALRFEGDVRRMLHEYKFRERLWLREDFADWLEGAVRARFDHAAVDLVIPFPTSPLHRLLRGYNQCDGLVKSLARRLDRPFRLDVLERIGNPLRQSSLDEVRRRENVKGTVAVARPEYVRGRTVLVVDDIMTTGSTLSETARVLKESAASRVWCVTVARSIRS